eukprot:2767579-Pyramimonas_sp.AAC.1
MPEVQGATVTLTRGVEVPSMVFLHDSGPSRRNSYSDAQRRRPRNESGGQVYCDIVGGSWVYIGPPPPPPPSAPPPLPPHPPLPPPPPPT